MAKLHGDVEIGNIVPPTWAKSITESVLKSWQIALQVLKACNHLRIIGYSLPITDSYVKYLLKAGVLDNNHLKSIDVICLDGSGEVERRYGELIDSSFRKLYRFRNRSVDDYLGLVYQEATSTGMPPVTLEYNKLEKVHATFMR